MKKIFTIIVILSFSVTSCKDKTDSTQKMPTDLVGLRALLKDKKLEIIKFNNDVKVIQAKIDSLDPKSKIRTLVTAFKLQKDDFNRYTEIQGTVQSDEVVKISSEVPGRLINVFVENGDKVHRGKLIANIDMESVSKKLEELEKAYELASDIYERQDRLWKQNIGSEVQFLSAKNNKERLEKSISSIKFQLKKANVYSPASGVIDMKRVEPGEMVSPGYPLMQILNTNKLKVVADVPEVFLTKVKKGDIISIRFPSLGEEVQGEISRIGNTIHPTNRTFTIEIKVKNNKHLLKPNLLAILLINDFSEKNAIVLQSELIQHEISGKAFVMIAKDEDDGKYAKKVYVHTGEEFDGKTIIIDGLKEENIIIDKGARSVVNHEPIQLEK